MTTPPPNNPFAGPPPTAAPPQSAGSPYWNCLVRAYYDGRQAFQSLRHDGMTAASFNADPAAETLFKALADYCGKYTEGLPSLPTLEGAWGVTLPSTPPVEPLPFWLEILRTIRGQEILRAGLEQVSELTEQGHIDTADAILAQTRDAVRATWDRSLRARPLWALRGEVVRKYEAAKRGEVGVPFPWPTINRFTRGAHPEDLILFVARTGVGKCLAHDQIVYDGDTGAPMTAEAAYHHKIGHIPSMHHEGEGARVEQVSAWMDSGVRPLLEITLASGRKLKVSPEHKLLTPQGWQEAQALVPGCTLAIPQKHPQPRRAVSRDGLFLDLLAYDCWSRWPWRRYGLASLLQQEMGKEIIAHAREKLEGQKRLAPQAPWDELTAAMLTYYVEREGVPSREKARHFPSVAFALTDPCLARFLGRLWALGGLVTAVRKGDTLVNGRVSYMTASERYAHEMQHLLLRLGIHATVGAPNTKGVRTVNVMRPYWELLRALLGPYLSREQTATLGAILANDATRKGGLLYCGHPGFADAPEAAAIVDRGLASLPAEGMKAVRAVYVEQENASYRLARGHFFMPGRPAALRASMLRALVATSTDEAFKAQYGWTVQGEVVWDPIRSVTPIAPAQCYDFTVPSTSCFLAQDVVIHNSWALILWAIHAVRAGSRVLLVTTELAQETVACRGMGVELHLPYERLRQGTLSKTDESRLYTFASDPDVENLPLFVYGGDFELNLESLEGAIEETNPHLVLIDGIYLFKSAMAKGQQSRTDRVTANFNHVKQLAKKMRVAMGVSTQLNREAAKSKGQGGGAALHHISLTDAASWNSDLAFALEQDQDQADDGEMKVTCLKGREMRKIPQITVNWKMDVMDFSEIASAGVGQAVDGLGGGAVADDEIVPF